MMVVVATMTFKSSRPVFLSVAVAVNVPLRRLDGPMTSQQLHVPQTIVLGAIGVIVLPSSQSPDGLP
jgi:hypothetical protein